MMRVFFFLLFFTVLNGFSIYAQCPLNLGEIPPVPEDDLLLYFPFDGTAENFGDSTYSAEVNGARYVETGCGQGLEFDGDDDYVLVEPSLYLDDDYTVTAWINARTFEDAMGIFSIREQCINTYRGFSISELKVGGNVDFPTLKNSINKHIDCVSFSGGDRYTDTDLILPENQDIFISLTVKNNRSENRQVKLYVNCQEYKALLVDNQSTSICFDNPLIEYMTTIGSASNVPGREKSFNGTVDEVRAYERVLSHDEIINIYRNCRPVAIEQTRFTTCESDSAVIILNNTQLGVNYQLYDLTTDTVLGPLLSGNCGSLFFFTDRVDTITSYEIVATDTLSGCSIRIDSVINLNPLDSLDFSFDFSFPNFACLKDSTQVLYEGDSTLSREWLIRTPSFEDSLLLNRDSFSIQFVDTGEYSVSLIVEDENGCVDTLTKRLVVTQPLVEANFFAIHGLCDDTIGVMIVDETISRDSLGYTSEWSFFNPADSLISTQRPFFITEVGEYTVVLKVTDSNGCMDTTSRSVSSPFIGLGCCPDFTVPPVEACNSTRLEICGQTNLDSCFVDYLYAEYTFTYDDTVEIIERVPVDSSGRFCFEADASILDREACVTAWVEVLFVVDSTSTDTIVIGSEIRNLAGECLNEICCPEDTIPIHIAKNLCLTGSNYSGAHFELEGSILLNQIPQDLAYCGFKPRFNDGIEVEYDFFTEFGGVVKFAGQMFIPNPDELERDPSTGKYIVRGTMMFCTKDGVECELDVRIRLSRSQVDMCVGMPGLMCMHFTPNTFQYRPPIPPRPINGSVYLPVSVMVPFGTHLNEETECEVDRYDFEICGIPKQSGFGGNCKPISTGSIRKEGNEVAGTFFDFLVIPVQLWNSFEGIEITFWNNCGDTCAMHPIPVIPVPGGRGEILKDNKEDGIEVYPIPFTDRLIISYPDDWGDGPFFIYTIGGRQVYEGQLKADSVPLILKTANWSVGTYVFYAKNGKGNVESITLIKN